MNDDILCEDFQYQITINRLRAVHISQFAFILNYHALPYIGGIITTLPNDLVLVEGSQGFVIDCVRLPLLPDVPPPRPTNSGGGQHDRCHCRNPDLTADLQLRARVLWYISRCTEPDECAAEERLVVTGKRLMRTYSDQDCSRGETPICEIKSSKLDRGCRQRLGNTP